MSKSVHFDDLNIGDRWVSAAKEITGPEGAQFSELTLDFNKLHLCEDFASESPFGRPIAHGLLGLSLSAGLASECPKIDTIALLGLYDWVFVRPIYYGDQIHVVSEVLELEPSGRKRGRVLWQRELVNQNGYTVQHGRLDLLVSRTGAAKRQEPVEHNLESLVVGGSGSSDASQ